MSSRLRAAILLAVAVVAPVGCARSVMLDVSYPESAVNRAMLAAARPRRVEIRPVVDRRLDATRIGVQPEGDKPILTSRAVVDVVREALVSEVQRNGHAATADGANLVLAADVDEFWLDAVVGHSAVQYVGKVALTVTLVDVRTGETILTRRYVGIRRQQGPRDARQVGLAVMDVALSRVMHDLATDPELADAFGRRVSGARNI